MGVQLLWVATNTWSSQKYMDQGGGPGWLTVTGVPILLSKSHSYQAKTNPPSLPKLQKLNKRWNEVVVDKPFSVWLFGEAAS